MKTKVSIGATIALAAIAVAITFVVTVNIMTARFNEQMSDMQSMKALYSKLQEISVYIGDSAYYEPDDSIRSDYMAEGYAAALYEAGDKYARYYSAEEYAQSSKETAGTNAGIGISVIEEEDGSVYIYRVYHGSPAHKAGIKAGQTVTAVSDAEGDILVTNKDGYSEFIKSFPTEIGTTVTLTVTDGDSSKDFTVTVSEYEYESVWVEYAGSVAIVRIGDFNADTDEAFVKIIDEIEKNNEISGVVFDVRNNGGGLLTTVVNMLDRLLPEGVILTEKNRDGVEIAKFTSDATKFSKPMAVLVNGATASASELFACALRDYNKAELVGEKTYGKGCAQTVFVLSDGSAICFTTAMYYPPASDNYEGVGLTPDELIELTDEQVKAFYSLTVETDPQLKQAIKMVTPASSSSQSSDNAAA